MSVVLAAAFTALAATATAQQVVDGSAVPPPAAEPQRSADDLQKLAAPMALYPDPLIAVMLPASAYPVEIVQAARFVSDTNNLDKLDDQSWDANVKAVARFPTVIQKMSADLSWTVELGQAFVDQPGELMDAIQALRTQAQSFGTLQTTPQQVVIVTNAVVERTYESQVVFVTNSIVQIMPANPQVVYVPVYNPAVVYVAPPPVYNPAPLVTFGLGIAVGVLIANNHCDWHYGGVYYGHGGVVVWGGGGRYPYYPPPAYYRPPRYYPPPGYRPPPPGYRPPGYPPPAYHPPRPTPYSSGNRPTASTLPANSGGGAQRWQPDQNRIRSSGTPNTQASINTMEARGWGSGAGPATTRPTTGAAATRPASGAVANNAVTRPAPTTPRPTQGTPAPSTPRTSYNPPVQPNVTRPAPSTSSGNRSTGPSQTLNRPSQTGTGQTGAFSGVANGSSARDFSNRGAASRGVGQNSTAGKSVGGRR